MNYYLIIGGLVAAYILYNIVTGVLRTKKEKKIGTIKAVKEHVKEQLVPSPRIDRKAAEEWSPKSLGGQPLYYNEVDHSYGRFVGMFRTDDDMADSRVIHNNCYRIRYLKDVVYFWFIKSSKEEVTPCVFRPGIDVINKTPGEEAGVPSEGLVILRRSMDGQRLYQGPGDRYRHLLMQEKDHSKMLADMLLSVQDKQRLAHMDPGGKEYVEIMTEMLKRTKQIHDAAGRGGGGSDLGMGMGNPYSQEMYGGEDTTPSPSGGEDSGLWRLG